MRPLFQNIDVAIDSSLKIETYLHSKSCELTNWHIHPEYELVFVKNGKGSLRIANKTKNYYDGTLLFLGPNIPHADFGNKDHKNNLEVVVQFGKEFIEEKLTVFPEFKEIKKLIYESKKVLLFDNVTKNRLTGAFELLKSAKGPQRLIHFLSILDELTEKGNYETVLGEASSELRKSIDVDRLENIFEYVNEHYDEKITVEAMASRSGLTTNSFCRFFKKTTNKSFIQFLNEYRTRKASEYFDETELSVSEVMYKCGYNDASYFTRQFKKHQGTTPSGYLLDAV